MRETFGTVVAMTRPAALDHPEHGGLGVAFAGPSVAALPAPADVRLVNLNVPAERSAFVAHEFVADLVEHPPRGLVVDAYLPLKPLGGDTALHERDARVRRFAPDRVASVHRSHGQHCLSPVGRPGAASSVRHKRNDLGFFSDDARILVLFGSCGTLIVHYSPPSGLRAALAGSY